MNWSALVEVERVYDRENEQFQQILKNKDTHDHDMDLAHDTHGGGKGKY